MQDYLYVRKLRATVVILTYLQDLLLGEDTTWAFVITCQPSIDLRLLTNQVLTNKLSSLRNFYQRACKSLYHIVRLNIAYILTGFPMNL